MALPHPHPRPSAPHAHIVVRDIPAPVADAPPAEERWARVPVAPPNAIFHLDTLYKADKDPLKLNLGIGAYRDEHGHPYVFRVVRQVEKELLLDQHSNKDYLPIQGHAQFLKLAGDLVLGDELRHVPRGSAQAIGGTGALALGADFLRRFGGDAPVLIPDPTWANHKPIFDKAGFSSVKEYRYYNTADRCLNFTGLCDDLRAAKPGTIVLLHACAHNPTGLDPTLAQWQTIASIMQERRHFAFFDCAYQGFASGDLNQDAAAVRMFAAKGMDMCIAQSFSKNMGLYSERVGAIHFLAKTDAVAAAVASQLCIITRTTLSNCPGHGVRIAARILSDPKIRAEWVEELASVVQRIHRMRRLLYIAVKARAIPGTWEHIIQQQGMFSYSGLTVPQSQLMVSRYHVYMLDSGRINVAGLSASTVPRLADCIHAVVTGATSSL